MNAFDAAREAARRGDWPACLSALLAVWRAVKDPDLAALIDQVSQKAAGAPVVGGSAGVKKRLASATDADVAPILEYALTQMRTYPRAYEAVVELALARPPDPRVAAALAQIVRDPPFVELKRGGRGGLQENVVLALHRIADPRSYDLLRSDAARLDAERRAIRKHRRGLDTLVRVASELPDDEARIPDFHAQAREIFQALDSPTQHARRKDTRELLAAIFANPSDTGLRQVYADALQDAGDPRGEFIALQCGRADDAPPSKRERELLEAHERKWLGDLEPIVRKQGLVYRRGFVACLREGLKYTKHAPLFTLPDWATVEAIELDIWTETATSFLCDPRWTALRAVYGLYHATFESLAGRTFPWTALGIRYARPENWRLAADVLPAVVELDLAHSIAQPVDHLRAIADTPLADRVRRIRVLRSPTPAAALASILPHVGLEIVPEYTFRAAPEGEAVVVTGTSVALVHHGAKLDLRHALRVLGELPKITAITLHAPAKRRVDEAQWASLVALLAKHDLALAHP